MPGKPQLRPSPLCCNPDLRKAVHYVAVPYDISIPTGSDIKVTNKRSNEDSYSHTSFLPSQSTV